MEPYNPPEVPTVGLIACCECATPIEPNAANMCVGCLRSRVDITVDAVRESQLHACRNCERYFSPPNHWTVAGPESKELLALCLKRLKPGMTKVRLVDASFVWTEPHSKRVKVKLTIQKEVLAGAILQQAYVVEFTLFNQMCDDCRRVEAKEFWRACVQVRQKCEHKRTMFFLEQLLLKHNGHAGCTNVKPVPTGLDFFFAKQQEARKLVDFLAQQLPCRYHYSQQLISHDPKSSIYDYKHTFCVELVPITKDALVCLPRGVAQRSGNMGQFALCLRVTNVVVLMDPSTLQMHEVSASAYWREPFEILCQPTRLQQYFVLDVEDVTDAKLGPGHGHLSTKHQLADVWLVRANQVGQTDAATLSCRTHLGRWLEPGDVVLGYELRNANLNDPVFDAVLEENRPDVVLVKKHYDRQKRSRHRQWQLKRLYDGAMGDTASVENEFIGFMEDLEEDAVMRERVNIYRKPAGQAAGKQRRQHSKAKRPADDAQSTVTTTTDEGGEIHLPEGPTLEEMLDDLDLNADDGEGAGEGGGQSSHVDADVEMGTDH